MSRRDLWWLGLAVVAGLAVGLMIRQTHDPSSAVASTDATARLAVSRGPASPASAAPSAFLSQAVAQGTTSSTPFATERAQCVSGGAVGSGNEGLLDDCSVLLAAKDTLRGTETLNWSADTAIANWDGVTVSGSPRRVTRLYLDSNTSPQTIGRRLTLTGAIPPELGSLSKLERLTLSRHDLTGTIPAELGKLTELTDLSLHGNELTGGIPAELGNLSNLTRLSLRNNPLGGGIPVELGSLSNLDTLSLENSHLTGGIPASLGDLSELFSLGLSRNTMLSGCIPASLRGLTLSDLGSLGLDYCTTTTTYALTTSAEGNGRISPLPGTYSYLSGESVTVTATPDVGHEITSWGGACSGTASTCVLTMDAAKTASVTFEPLEFTLTVVATGTGSVTPAGTTTHDWGTEVTLAASWNDATHDFTGWGGDCSGAGSTCVLTMEADKSVTAAFTELPASRCATVTDADCLRAVYRGAPGDYAQVVDIPAAALLAADEHGRYYVERGEQVTVVTAAPLPTGYTRFHLERTPLGSPAPLSFEQLIPPVGTTYTFTATEAEDGPTLITFDLTAARPRPISDKPELGDVVVTTAFQVVSCGSGIAVPNAAANAELVGDCEHLLALRDTLAGTAALNWGAGRAMTSWTGVTVSGTPRRVTALSLANSGLTGELTGLLGTLTALTELRLDGNALPGMVPSKLSQLAALTHLYLAGNDLTGCVPSSLRMVANNDIPSLGLADCGAPTDISHGQHLVEEGTYEYSFQGVTQPLIFDVPAGLRFDIRGVVMSEPPTDGSVGLPVFGLLLQDVSNRFLICLELERGEECYRVFARESAQQQSGRSPAPGNNTAATVGPLLDRLAESLWLDGSR